MLLRGAETPKSKFSYFRVAQKHQKANLHASAWRGNNLKEMIKKAPQILVCEAYIIHILILSIQGNGSLCEV